MIEALLVFALYFILSIITMAGFWGLQIWFGSVADLDPDNFLVRWVSKAKKNYSFGAAKKAWNEASAAMAQTAEIANNDLVQATNRVNSDYDILWLTDDRTVTSDESIFADLINVNLEELKDEEEAGFGIHTQETRDRFSSPEMEVRHQAY